MRAGMLRLYRAVRAAPVLGISFVDPASPTETPLEWEFDFVQPGTVDNYSGTDVGSDVAAVGLAALGDNTPTGEFPYSGSTPESFVQYYTAIGTAGLVEKVSRTGTDYIDYPGGEAYAGGASGLYVERGTQPAGSGYAFLFEPPTSTGNTGVDRTEARWAFDNNNHVTINAHWYFSGGIAIAVQFTITVRAGAGTPEATFILTEQGL